MAKKSGDDFEKQLSRLQAVVENLEKGDPPLEEAVALYKEGLGLVNGLRERLQKAKHDITLLSQGVFKEFVPDKADDQDE